MVHIPRYQIFLAVILCVAGVLFAMPNFLGKTKLPSFLPQNTVNLGLDLQGGSHLLLDVGIDVVFADQMKNTAQQIRRDFRRAKIAADVAEQETRLSIRLEDDATSKEARDILRKIGPDYQINTIHNGYTVTFSQAGRDGITSRALSQSIEIVRRRIDETGTREPIIARQGDRRIVVQIPGLDDPERVKELLGKTARLTFHLVDRDGGIGTISYPSRDLNGAPLSIKRREMLTGDMVTNARPNFFQGAPIVSFTLNATGARRFCDVTSKHSGDPFAIVLDGEIISAPRINEPICGGAAQISGQFTVEEASDLALLLRAGALPAPLAIVEERTVGPSLGQDSVNAGAVAGMIGFAAVVIFMIASYGLFGLFAAIALIFNVIFIFGILAGLQATLTLPGIGGIILTIGMAVDANVLIFERIREEMQLGRTLKSAIDMGYKSALSTIMDANITTLIAALFLYSFGTGPIKGFAVTLTIGILTSLFSAILLTRIMVVGWMNKTKAKTVRL